MKLIAHSWVAARGEYGEAWEKLQHCCWHDPESAIRIIEEIHHYVSSAEPVDYRLMGLLAAGPLEDLLSEHGELVMPQVEALAKTDMEFRKCLTGVWRGGMSHELFARVQKAMHPAFRLRAV